MENLTKSKELPFRPLSGALMLIGLFVYISSMIGLVSFLASGDAHEEAIVFTILPGLFVMILWAVGFFIVEPNEARVLVLFGTYKGSVRDNGFY